MIERVLKDSDYLCSTTIRCNSSNRRLWVRLGPTELCLLLCVPDFCQLVNSSDLLQRKWRHLAIIKLPKGASESLEIDFLQLGITFIENHLLCVRDY